MLFRITFPFSKLSCTFFQLLHDLKIRWTSPVTTARLYFWGAKAWKFMINPVKLDLLYHVEDRFPSRFRIFMSHIGNEPSFCLSNVKVNELCNEFISCSFCSMLSLLYLSILRMGKEYFTHIPCVFPFLKRAALTFASGIFGTAFPLPTPESNCLISLVCVLLVHIKTLQGTFKILKVTQRADTCFFQDVLLHVSCLQKKQFDCFFVSGSGKSVNFPYKACEYRYRLLFCDIQLSSHSFRCGLLLLLLIAAANADVTFGTVLPEDASCYRQAKTCLLWSSSDRSSPRGANV